MNYGQIAKMPTTLTREMLEKDWWACKGWHESLLRSYQILAKVKWLLEKRTDNEVILELIALMENEVSSS